MFGRFTAKIDKRKLTRLNRTDQCFSKPGSGRIFGLERDGSAWRKHAGKSMRPGLGYEKELNLYGSRHKSWHVITHAEYGFVHILCIRIISARVALGLGGTMFKPRVKSRRSLSGPFGFFLVYRLVGFQLMPVLQLD